MEGQGEWIKYKGIDDCVIAAAVSHRFILRVLKTNGAALVEQPVERWLAVKSLVVNVFNK